MDSRYVAFAGIAALLTITPGPDMAVVTRSALDRGFGAAVRTTLGVNAGLAVWALAAAAGVAAVLAASATAFDVLKLVGAAYLIFLGGQAILKTRKPEPEARGGGSFRRGFIANLLNPKIGVFYSTFLPQFLVPGHSVLLQSLALATLHNVMGLVWLPSYARIVVRAGDFLRRPGVRRALDRVTGSVLVGLGIRLAFERR